MTEDDDVLIAQVEADPIEPNNRIADLLSAIEQGSHLDAENTFNDLIGDRLNTALDQRKVSLAQSTFDNEVDETEYEDDVDLSVDDEEFESELDDLVSSLEDEEPELELDDEFEN